MTKTALIRNLKPTKLSDLSTGDLFYFRDFPDEGVRMRVNNGILGTVKVGGDSPGDFWDYRTSDFAVVPVDNVNTSFEDALLGHQQGPPPRDMTNIDAEYYMDGSTLRVRYKDPDGRQRNQALLLVTPRGIRLVSYVADDLPIPREDNKPTGRVAVVR